ncbi:2-hydroxyacid dehydrogenase [Aquibacillus albus]|uniref:Glyoxylate reductase n=1 Tax=Aquibacillus albus TaxID=1168171 RepID=A0ABS2MYI0_9BACI|nr:D-glycerate dehydrogenase [Aquibacillus albus]MBM7570941.1 glyoxylate reductase [Aquibacillus albus]
MTKPYIYITRKIPEELIVAYQDRYTINMWPHEQKPVEQETLALEAQKADALLTMLSDKIDMDVLNDAENLKIIANLAVGYDNINLEDTKRKEITVTNTPDVLTETTADLTFALLLSTARRIVEASDFIKNGKWQNWSPFLLAGSDAYNKTIGIVGMGRIGEAVARRAKGFGMNIIYHNRTRKGQAEEELNASYVSFDTLLAESDFVVCLAPLTPETRGMFNEQAFRKMKQSAIFINASRGQNVDEDALYDALVNGEIKGAGLDVFAKEPIGKEHPLLKLDQVVCLPHIGSSSTDTRSTMIDLCLNNIDLVLSGRKPHTPVL